MDSTLWNELQPLSGRSSCFNVRSTFNILSQHRKNCQLLRSLVGAGTMPYVTTLTLNCPRSGPVPVCPILTSSQVPFLWETSCFLRKLLLAPGSGPHPFRSFLSMLHCLPSACLHLASSFSFISSQKPRLSHLKSPLHCFPPSIPSTVQMLLSLLLPFRAKVYTRNLAQISVLLVSGTFVGFHPYHPIWIFPFPIS